MHARPGQIRATCLDGDPQALRHASEFAKHHGLAAQASFVSASVLRLAHGEASLSLPPQQLVYMLGFLEYLDDAQVVSTVDWAYDVLEPGGTFMATNLAAGGADRVFMEHILEWRVRGRTEEQLQALVAQSRFGRGSMAAETELMRDRAGGDAVRAVRAGVRRASARRKCGRGR